MTLSVEKSVLLHFAHVGPRKFPGDGEWIVGGVIRERWVKGNVANQVNNARRGT